MNIALFDFDGTITHCDTFTPFIKTATSSRRLGLGSLLLLPSIVGYRLGIVSGAAVRKQVVYIGLRGAPKDHLQALGAKHAEGFLPSVVRDHALERIQWHKASGDRVIVVSASLDLYLKPWCEAMGVELICSELEATADVFTGRYATPDCSGAEKVRRVKSLIELADYKTIYAYGDTKEDNALLAMANERYFQWKKL